MNEPARVFALTDPGPRRLRREEVASSQRARLLRAMAEVAAEKGYANTVVADVIARAGVSRRTFYELFRDKQDCFLAAYAETVELLSTRLIVAAISMMVITRVAAGETESLAELHAPLRGFLLANLLAQR